ncbi:nucleotidyltransferase domain-containing protein [Brunnivagina elsteri]|uniref:Polymerase beta nucleotidyltransferase domain-containing protein n=1 Tax=Brunnivagina elsteri CCALA 953 TaxID=987040 RepID=A0A2A2TFU0_9CYAN|nr:nucleotidyltransferase domain-containing protein [Calothrix elsteri]PAX52667.1 hypothetical protein CK510_18085 [Calothrix elsteri CCALA 953]
MIFLAILFNHDYIPIENDPILTAVVDELSSEQNCHTVILYGSRAKGTHTANSDYDILAVREIGQTTRDARLWNGAYLDIFIYNEGDILDIDASFLRLLGGIVLRCPTTRQGVSTHQGIGHQLLAKVAALYASTPPALQPNEIELRRIWLYKMLERIATGDIEANYRGVWLLYALLEDYFDLRQQWYLGSKASWNWLQVHDQESYATFAAALKPGASISAIQSLVGTVFAPYHSQGREVLNK